MTPLRVAAATIDAIPLADRRGLVLTLRDDDGRTGLGEATPLPGTSPDDADSCERALREAASALGPLDPAAPGLPAAAVRRALTPLDPLLAPLPAARFALETALLDLLGQRLAQPLAACLGGPRPYAEVPVNGLAMASAGPDALLAAARALLARGVTCLKVKLRARGDDAFAAELTALTALRRELPPAALELRLDPNGAWTPDEARLRLAALAPLAPRFVEQPIAPHLLHTLGLAAAPWAADESLGLPGMPERLLDAPGCAAFVLKPAALGLLRAHQIACLAQARGLGVVVTHLFDGPIALAAASELALSLPAPPLACGLDAHAGLAAWPPVLVPQRRGPAAVTASGRAGLGVDPWMA